MERRQGGETSGHEARRRTLASRSSSREACSSSRVRCSVSRMRRSSSCSSSSREEEGSVCTSTVTRPAAGPNGLSGLNGGGGGKDAGSGSAGCSRSSSLAFLSRSRESSSCCRVSRSSACIARKSASVTREGGLAAIMAIEDGARRTSARALLASSTYLLLFPSADDVKSPVFFTAACKTAQAASTASSRSGAAGQRVPCASLHARRQSEAQHSSRCDAPRPWAPRRFPCLHCAGPSHRALEALQSPWC